MSIADFILNTLGAVIDYGLALLPTNISIFTLTDLSDLLTSISNFWRQSFSLTSHFFPFLLFFIFLVLIVFMELSLLVFRVVKFVVNVFRGSGG